MSDFELRRLWRLVKQADALIGNHLESGEPISFVVAMEWLEQASRLTPSLRKYELGDEPQQTENAEETRD